MTQIVAIEDVKIGMYLTRINTSEGKLKVKSQGLIKSSSTIENLKRRAVLSIEIDESKSSHLPDKPAKQTEDNASAEVEMAASPLKQSFQTLSIDQQIKHLASADKLYTQARDLQSRFVKQLRSGDAPDFEKLNAVAQDIIDSVFENQEALSCLIMFKDTNNYLVEHSLNCSILLSLFASHRGFSQADLEDITLAGLLMDIGMVLLPSELNQKTESYTSSDIAMMRTHVDIGREIIDRYADLPSMVDEIVMNHHERIDGSGYPKQKHGDELSEYVKMASIVDCYDSMISDRGYRLPSRAQDALEFLLADPGFDTEMVQSFIEAIGLYPVGSLVHLQSGKLAMVVQKNKKHPLKPSVMAFYSIRAKHHTEVKLINLNKSNDKILCAVKPEEFEVNLPKFFRTVLLNH
jgi:HD-GYP domain-containing protein (c-di-GMP phosphodiesterase class II)